MSKVIDVFDQIMAVTSDLSVIHPGARQIPPETIIAYLQSFSNENDRAFAEKVLEVTRYIPQEQFLQALNNSFTQFEKRIGNHSFFVYLPSAKFGSESIFTLYLWSRIRRLNFQGFVTTDNGDSKLIDTYTGITRVIEGGSHILVVDDAVYIGNNALAIIDESTYFNRGRHLKQNPIYFHMVIPFVSTYGKEAISTFTSRDQFPVITLYPTEIMIPLMDRWTGYTEELMNRFELEFMHQVPIYFDHKVANEFEYIRTYLYARNNTREVRNSCSGSNGVRNASPDKTRYGFEESSLYEIFRRYPASTEVIRRSNKIDGN